MKRMTLAVALVLSLVTTIPAQAMGNWVGGDSQTDDVDYSAGKTALKAENWQGAIEAMNKVVARDPRHVNAYNWLGYAYRRLGNLPSAFKHYERALEINPKHRGYTSTLAKLI